MPSNTYSIDKEFVLFIFGMTASMFGILMLPVFWISPLYGFLGLASFVGVGGAIFWKILPTKKRTIKPKEKLKTTLALDYANQHGGVITVADLMREYNISVKEANTIIDSLTREGIIELNIEQDFLDSGEFSYKVSAPQYSLSNRQLT